MSTDRRDEWNLHVAANEGRTAPQLEGATPRKCAINMCRRDAIGIGLWNLGTYVALCQRHSERLRVAVTPFAAAPSRPVEREEPNS